MGAPGAAGLVKLMVINSHAQSGKMLYIKFMLSTITVEMPFSRAPKHPPAPVVQLRGLQHNSAGLWVCFVSRTVCEF